MHRALEWVQLVSYAAVSLVTVGTALRFLFKFVKNYDDDREFVTDLKEIYLKDIYAALYAIAKKVDVEIYLNPPGE